MMQAQTRCYKVTTENFRELPMKYFCNSVGTPEPTNLLCHIRGEHRLTVLNNRIRRVSSVLYNVLKFMQPLVLAHLEKSHHQAGGHKGKIVHVLHCI
jgi:hypothetical protein